MIKKNMIVLISFFFLFQNNAVFSQGNIIKWDKDILLSWNDFKEKKGAKVAYSAIAIKLKPLVSTTKRIKLSIYAYFDMSKSITGIYDDDVLNHEQFHFLIGELFARKLKKKILSVPKNIFFNDRTQFEVVYKENYEAYLSYQKKYDEETFYSVDKKAQINWEIKIIKELKEYHKYSSLIIDLIK